MTTVQVQQRPGLSPEELETRLAKLRVGTETAINAMATRARATLEEAALDTATANPKAQQRRAAAAERIRTLDLDKVKETVSQDQREIVMAIAGLAEISGQIDEGFKSISAPNPEDDALMARAKAAVADSKEELTAAEARWWNIFGWRDAAIARAKVGITEADKGVKVAEVEVQTRISDRLRSGNFQLLFQHFVLMSQKCLDGIEIKLKANAVESRSVNAAKTKSFTEKVEVTETMQALDGRLDSLKQQLETMRAELETLQPATPEYAAKQAEISELESTYQQAEEDRNAALKTLQELDKFIEALQVQETALKNIHQCLILSRQELKTSTPLRIKAYEAALRVQDDYASLRIAGKITEVGRETDQRLAEQSATIAAAAARDALRRVQEAPQAIRDMAETNANLVKALVPVMMGMEEEVKKLYANSGIDPNNSSFLTYMNEQAPKAAA